MSVLCRHRAAPCTYLLSIDATGALDTVDNANSVTLTATIGGTAITDVPYTFPLDPSTECGTFQSSFTNIDIEPLVGPSSPV